MNITEVILVAAAFGALNQSQPLGCAVLICVDHLHPQIIRPFLLEHGLAVAVQMVDLTRIYRCTAVFPGQSGEDL